jgi:hypothetical protein
MSQMQSASSRPRSRSDESAEASISVVTLRLSLRVSCDFLPDLCLGLPFVSNPADRARGTFHLFAGVRTFKLAQLLPGTGRKLRLGLVHCARVRAALQFFPPANVALTGSDVRKEKPASDKHQDQPWRRNPLGIVTSGILILTAYFLATEHTADLFGVLPSLLLAACLLMHLLDTPADPRGSAESDQHRRAAKSRMTATREQMLEIAGRAALAAGDAILGVYFTAFDVQQKTDKTPVTEADLASERINYAMLTEAFPDIPIVSEELVEAEGLPPWAARFWAVDPLDGTREFIAKNGEFAVSIGLVEDGIPILGIVHGPAVGVTYAACGPGRVCRLARPPAAYPRDALHAF